MNTQLARSPYDLTAIDRAAIAGSTRTKYRAELDKYLATGKSLTDDEALVTYASGLKPSAKAFLKAGLRLVTLDLERRLKGNVTPDTLAQTQAALMRIEAMRDSVTVKKSEGTKAHTWLSEKQVQEITSLCTDDLEGWRDWIVLGLLLGAGLRREELARLTFGALKEQHTKRGKLRHVLEVKGKGSKSRVIPLKLMLAERLLQWRDMIQAGDSDLIARSLGRKKILGGSISAVALFQIVRKYGRMIGKPELAPHDLRRTYAQLGYKAGVPITQISVLLGHSNSAVTQKYLDLTLDLETTVSDFIPLSGD